MSAFLAGVSGCSLIRWPSHVRRLLLIVLLQGVNLTRFFKSLVDIMFGYVLSITILSSLRWKASICFSVVAVSVHISA